MPQDSTHTKHTIPVSDIRQGDEFYGPGGQHHWTAIEPGYYANGAQRVQVQHWPDGGIGPEREWSNPDQPIIVWRAVDPAVDPDRPSNAQDAQDAITDAIANALHVLKGDELALADILREAMDSAGRHYRDEH